MGAWSSATGTISSQTSVAYSSYTPERVGGREKWRIVWDCSNCGPSTGNFDICMIMGSYSYSPQTETFSFTPALVPMADDPANYALVGADGPPNQKHFPNTTSHYLRPHVRAGVQAAAVRFHQLNPTWKLRINDASLEWGGVFDINGNWNPKHKNHREGRNVDVGWKGLKKVGSQWVATLMPPDLRYDMKELLLSGGGIGGIGAVNSEPDEVHEHVIGKLQP